MNVNANVDIVLYFVFKAKSAKKKGIKGSISLLGVQPSSTVKHSDSARNHSFTDYYRKLV